VKILIVDDEPNIVLPLEFLMRKQGHEVLVASDGDEALDAIGAFAPDLVLLDVMLPRRSGFEICQTLREEPAWRHIKVVLLTAKGRDVEVAKGMAVGADDYVTKPFSTHELVERVERLLGDREGP
jgi:DNA-binding response OmpR family regulator